MMLSQRRAAAGGGGVNITACVAAVAPRLCSAEVHRCSRPSWIATTNPGSRLLWPFVLEGGLSVYVVCTHPSTPAAVSAASLSVCAPPQTRSPPKFTRRTQPVSAGEVTPRKSGGGRQMMTQAGGMAVRVSRGRHVSYQHVLKIHIPPPHTNGQRVLMQGRIRPRICRSPS